MNLDRVYLLTPNAMEISAGLRLYPIEWQTITLISHHSLISGAQLAVKLQISPDGTKAVLSRLTELNIIREPEMTMAEYEAHLALFVDVVPMEELDEEFTEDGYAEEEEVPSHLESVVETQPVTEQHSEPVVEPPPVVAEKHDEPVVEPPPVVAEKHDEPVVEPPPVVAEKHDEPVVEPPPVVAEKHNDPVVEPPTVSEMIAALPPIPEKPAEPIIEPPVIAQKQVEPVVEPIKPETEPKPSEDKENPPLAKDSGERTLFSYLVGAKPKEATPVVTTKTGALKLDYPILPVMDFVRKQGGNGLAGHLAVYKMFLNVPQQLLEYSAWSIIDIERSEAKTDNRNLALAFIQAAEKVVGSPVPSSIRI